jgi:hypothetical protein
VTDSTGLEIVVGVGIVCLSQRGRVEIHIAASALTPQFYDLPESKISGLTDLDAPVVGHNCHNNRKFRSTTKWVAYYSFLSPEISIGTPTASAPHQVRHLKNSGIRIPRSTILDCDITLAPAENVAKDAGAIQAILTAENPQPGSNIDQTLKDVTRLLGVAFRARTQAPRIDYYDEGNWLGTTLIPSNIDDELMNDLIPWTGLEAFISQAVVGYRNNENEYSLRTVLYYYIRSHVESTLEVKFIFASVLVEALKFYWARNVAQFTPRMNANGTIKEFVKPPNGKYTFKELVNGMTAHLGLTATYTFIDDRNALFHTGLSVATQVGTVNARSALEAELSTLHDQVDDMVLTLLGYSGPFHPYWQAHLTLMFPGRAVIP